MHAGKKQSRRMKGGMTTGEWGTAVFGGSDSQQAVGAGSNVIRVHDPNSVVAAPQMKGGRRHRGGDLLGSVAGMFNADSKTPDAAPTAETSSGMFDSVTGLFESKPTEEEAAPVPASAEEATEASTEAAAPATGGKGKRKSATKRRKSHKKKGKSSKKRAHKRH